MDFADYNEIVNRRYDYALGIDTRDFDLLRSIFTDDVTMDFEDYSGQPSAVMKADDWVSGCKVLFTGLDATQHVMTNPRVEVNGDRATLKMYMKAEHFLNNDQGNADFALGGYYTDQLVRENGEWKICAVTLKIFWNRGNRHIMTQAGSIGASRLGLA